MTKLHWKLLIIFGFLLFIYSILSRQIYWSIIALVLGILINRQNLFKDYDE
ncbi:hypothetical protein STPL106120_03150 [Streptococcus pluranimalium]